MSREDAKEDAKFLATLNVCVETPSKKECRTPRSSNGSISGKMTKNDGPLQTNSAPFFLSLRTDLLSPVLVFRAMGTLTPPDVPAFWVAVEVSPGVAQSGSPYGGAMVAALWYDSTLILCQKTPTGCDE
jgi:hypothetical protein